MTIAPAINAVPKEPAIRRAWVQMQLRIRGLSFSEIARQERCSRQAVAAALLVPVYRLECAIAEAIGLQAQNLFPERYTADGRRLHQIRGDKTNTGGKRRNVYSRKVA